MAAHLALPAAASPAPLAPLGSAEALPAALHPVAVYLAGLAPGSRRSMRQALDLLADELGFAGAEAVPWWHLGYQHAQALRARLAARLAPASVNKTLSALRGGGEPDSAAAEPARASPRPPPHDRADRPLSEPVVGYVRGVEAQEHLPADLRVEEKRERHRRETRQRFRQQWPVHLRGRDGSSLDARAGQHTAESPQQDESVERQTDQRRRRDRTRRAFCSLSG